MAHYTQDSEISDTVLILKMKRAIKNLIAQRADEGEISDFLHGQVIDHNTLHGGKITLGQLNRFLTGNFLPSIEGREDDVLVEVF